LPDVAVAVAVNDHVNVNVNDHVSGRDRRPRHSVQWKTALDPFSVEGIAPF
jgi:hypothetical protein